MNYFKKYKKKKKYFIVSVDIFFSFSGNACYTDTYSFKARKLGKF